MRSKSLIVRGGAHQRAVSISSSVENRARLLGQLLAASFCGEPNWAVQFPQSEEISREIAWQRECRRVHSINEGKNIGHEVWRNCMGWRLVFWAMKSGPDNTNMVRVDGVEQEK